MSEDTTMNNDAVVAEGEAPATPATDMPATDAPAEGTEETATPEATA